MQHINYIIKKFLLLPLICTALSLSFVGCNDGNYEYIEVSLPSGCIAARPTAINNNGVVVGELQLGGGWRLSIPNTASTECSSLPGFIYRDGEYTKLCPPGWPKVNPEGINDNNVVVEWGGDSGGLKGFIYSDGEYTFLSPEEGWTDAFPVAINNSGAVIGYFENRMAAASRHSLGFIYNEGKYTELLPDESANMVTLIDINDSGVVVGGFSINEYNPYKMFIYSDGTYSFLLPPEGWRSGGPIAINDNGVILGGGLDGDGAKRFFIYDDGQYTELPPLPDGWHDASVWGFNNNGEMVGNAFDNEENDYQGFVYSNGEYTFLLPKGWYEAEAVGINDSGVVVGHGRCTRDPETGAYSKWFMAIPKS